MNPRRIALRYMGWCPGVEHAASFVPDEDLPPSKLAATALIGVLVFAAGFLATQHLIMAGGGTQPVVYNENPHLVCVDGELYLYMTVETRTVRSQDPLRDVVRVKVDLDGHAYDREILSRRMSIADVYVTDEGVWYVAYSSGGVKVRRSEDGVDWGEPVTIAENKGDKEVTPLTGRWGVYYGHPSLAEMKDGRLFLVFSRLEKTKGVLEGMTFINRSRGVYYSILDEDGWSKPVHIPVLVPRSTITEGSYGNTNINWKRRDVFPLEPSCLTLRDGRTAVLAVDGNPYDWDVEGIWLTKMKESGEWTKPEYLFFYRGRDPRMFHSPSRDQYILYYRNDDQWQIELASTQDMENWGRPTSFSAQWQGSMMELPNETTVLAYEKGTRVYLTYTSDGVNWAEQRTVEKISIEYTREKAQSQQVTFLSALSGLTTGILSSILAINIISRRPSWN